MKGVQSFREAPVAVETGIKDESVFRVVGGGEGGRRDVFMLTSDFQTTRLGSVNVPDSDKVLAEFGTFNEGTKTWDVPKDVATALMQGRLSTPDFIRAKWRASEASTLRGLVFKKWLRGEMSTDEAKNRGERELLKIQLGEQPEAAWNGGFGNMIAEAIKDPVASARGTARFAAGETAALVPFVLGASEEAAKSAALLGAGGIAITAAVLGTGGLATPAATAGVVGLMNTGAAFGVFKYTMDVEGGNLAGDMLDAGFEEQTVKDVAPVAGAISGLLELVQFKFLTAPLKRAVMSRVITSKAMTGAMAKWYVNYSKELGAEVTIEVAQERVNQLAINLSAAAEEKPELLVDWEKNKKQLWDTAFRSLAGIAVIKVPGAAIEAGVQRVETARAARLTRRLEEREDRRQADIAAEKKIPPTDIGVLPEPAPLTKEDKLEATIEKKPTPETAVEISEQAQAVLEEEVQIREEQVVEGVEEQIVAAERGERLERETREVEAKGRIRALESDLRDVSARINDLTVIRDRFERRGEPTQAITNKLERLLDEEETIKRDLTFFEAAGELAAVTSKEVLQIKPVTLENIVAAGFREGRAEVIKTRSKVIKNIASARKLSQADVRKILKNKNIGLMGDVAFKNFVKDFEKQAKAVNERKAALREVRIIQKEKAFVKERNLRSIEGLPTMRKMTTAQLTDYAKLLSEYDKGDEFFTRKRFKALENTEFSGLKTYRQVLQTAADKLGKPIGDFRTIKVTEFTRGFYDTLLAAQNPFFDMVVRHGKTAQLKAERLKDAFRTQLRELAGKAIASRRKLQGVGERVADFLAPQQVALFDFIQEQNDETRTAMAAALTKEELELAEFLRITTSRAFDYLIKSEEVSSSRFIGAYVYHRGRSVSEMIRDLPKIGIRETLKDFFRTFKEKSFETTAIAKNGQALGLRTFFKQTLFRTEELIPSKNVVKSMEIYFDQFFDKVALDEMVPSVDTLTRALLTLDKTPDAKANNEKVLSFVKEYLNAKKGNAQWVFDKGGMVEAVVRTGMTLAALKFIALNIPLQIASPVGEFAAEYIALGKIKFAKAKIRKLTKQGRKILEENKAFIGEGVLEQFIAPAKDFGDRLGIAMYGSFRISRIRTMEDLILGNMTDEEFKSGKISDERLVTIKLAAGRWVDIFGSKSIRGQTVAGAGWTQFKGWAIPPITTIAEDALALGRGLATLGKKPPTPEQAVEMYRLAELAAITMFLMSATKDFEDDDSFQGKTLRYMVREIGSPFQALLSVPSLGFGIWADVYTRIGANLLLIAKRERFKTKPGLKGVAGLKRELTPAAVKQFMKPAND